MSPGKAVGCCLVTCSSQTDGEKIVSPLCLPGVAGKELSFNYSAHRFLRRSSLHLSSCSSFAALPGLCCSEKSEIAFVRSQALRRTQASSL